MANKICYAVCVDFAMALGCRNRSRVASELEIGMVPRKMISFPNQKAVTQSLTHVRSGYESKNQPANQCA